MKKTNSKKPRKRTNHRIKRDKRNRTNGSQYVPKCLSDPLFLHFAMGAIGRYLELAFPAEFQLSRIDAEFVPPSKFLTTTPPPTQEPEHAES